MQCMDDLNMDIITQILNENNCLGIQPLIQYIINIRYVFYLYDIYRFADKE